MIAVLLALALQPTVRGNAGTAAVTCPAEVARVLNDILALRSTLPEMAGATWSEHVHKDEGQSGCFLDYRYRVIRYDPVQPADPKAMIAAVKPVFEKDGFTLSVWLTTTRPKHKTAQPVRQVGSLFAVVYVNGPGRKRVESAIDQLLKRP